MAIKNLTLPSCFKGLEIFGEKSSLYFINVLLCFQKFGDTFLSLPIKLGIIS
jgi:hypothetical protein